MSNIDRCLKVWQSKLILTQNTRTKVSSWGWIITTKSLTLKMSKETFFRTLWTKFLRPSFLWLILLCKMCSVVSFEFHHVSFVATLPTTFISPSPPSPFSILCNSPFISVWNQLFQHLPSFFLLYTSLNHRAENKTYSNFYYWLL